MQEEDVENKVKQHHENEKEETKEKLLKDKISEEKKGRNEKKRKKENDLHGAVIRGDLQKVQEILSSDYGKKIINSQDYLKRTPLHLAAFGGKIEVVRLLLENQSDLACVAQDGMTSLHFAAQNGHTDVVQLLCNKGANVNAKLAKGRKTPLHLSCAKGHIETSVYLIFQGAKIDILNSRGEKPFDVVPTPEIKEEISKRIKDYFENKTKKSKNVLQNLQKQIIEEENEIILQQEKDERETDNKVKETEKNENKKEENVEKEQEKESEEKEENNLYILPPEKRIKT